jgi:hypothetical protein
MSTGFSSALPMGHSEQLHSAPPQLTNYVSWSSVASTRKGQTIQSILPAVHSGAASVSRGEMDHKVSASEA